MPSPLEDMTNEERWDALNRITNYYAAEKGVYGGMPMLHDTLELVLEKRYPFQGLQGMSSKKVDEAGLRTEQKLSTGKKEEEGEYPKVINHWISKYPKYHGQLIILYINEPGGRLEWAVMVNTDTPRWVRELETLGCYRVWNVDAECDAQLKLKSLVSDAQFKSYFCTGSFLEQSRRSQVAYMFRRL